MDISDLKRRFRCRNCQRETSHWPIKGGQVHGSERPLEGSSSSFQMFQVVQCQECRSITFCVDTMIHPGPMIGHSYTQSTEYYPPLPFRTKPQWYKELPEFYENVLNEIYQALDHTLFFLASTGTRTALDRLMVEKIGDMGSFKSKVEKLFSTEMIDDAEKEMLLALIDAGSASAHRSYSPDSETMNYMMDMLEEVFHKLIVAPRKKQDLTAKAKSLRDITPKRGDP